MKVKELIKYEEKSKIKAGEAVENGKYPFFTSSEAEDKRYNDYTCDTEGIIMGTGGNATLHYCNGRFAVSTDCLVLKTNDKVNCKYLFYFFKANMNILQAGFKGAGLKHTNKNYIENIEIIRLPDINQQKHIVYKLEKVESIIKKQSGTIDYFDTLIKARFVEMFGDVVKNTKNWKTKKLNELCGFNNNKLGVDSIHNKVWLLNLDMIESDSGKIIDYYMIDEKEVPSSTISFNENCVLYSKLRPYLNKVVTPIKSGYATSELIAIETNSLINKYFLAFALRSKSFVDMINLTSYGAKMPRASVDALKNFYIPVPDIEIQNTFATFVKEVDKLKFDVQKSLEKTQMLFDSLMQEYFN